MPFTTVYDPRMSDTIIACAREGGSIVVRCVAIGICRQTYYEWTDPSGEWFKPDFYDAHLMAEELCQEWWEKQGAKGLWTNPKEERFDSRVWQLNMMNRFGWGLKNENKNENTEIVINDGGSDAPSHD